MDKNYGKQFKLSLANRSITCETVELHKVDFQEHESVNNFLQC